LLPSPSLVPAFLGADHQLGERAPFGSCAFCHSDKVDAVRNNGGADLGCLLCHEREQGPFGPGHRSIPSPSQVPSFVGTAHGDPTLRAFGSCAFCHRSKTDQALQFRHGNLALDCDRCHLARQDAAFGPGHATVTPCSACHGSERQTHHDPQEGTPYACAICHDPHGSENLFLIARFFRTPSGELRALRFDNLGGLADGGFASVSEPGTGLCETCHEKTRFFRFDGSGEPHFAFPCFTCHPHRLGFSVRP
jgi:predicted CXXCH cytochrome family protein